MDIVVGLRGLQLERARTCGSFHRWPRQKHARLLGQMLLVVRLTIRHSFPLGCSV